MNLKVNYKPDLCKGDVLYKTNVLSFRANIKTYGNESYLPMVEINWSFIWSLVFGKIKGKKLFIMITPVKPDGTSYFDIFRISKKDKIKNKK